MLLVNINKLRREGDLEQSLFFVNSVFVEIILKRYKHIINKIISSFIHAPVKESG